MEAVQREVEIVLRLVPDKENSQAAEKIAKQIEDAHRKAEQAAKKSHKTQVDLVKKQEEEAKKAAKERQKEAEKAAKEAEKAAKEKQRLLERESRLLAQAEVKKQRSMEKETAMLARQADMQARIQERNFVKANAAIGKYEQKALAASDSTLRVVDNVLNLAEGVAMLGLAGEEDLEKLARGFVKVRAGIDLVRGAFGTFFELQKILKAVRDAADAAAAAQQAAAAAGMLGGAGGTAGRSAVAGAGGAAAGSAGGGLLAGTAAGAAATVGKVAIGAVLLYEAMAYAARNFTNAGDRAESLTTLIPTLIESWTAAAKSAEDLARKQAQYNDNRMFRMESQFAGLREQADIDIQLARLQGGDRASAMEALEKARARKASALSELDAARRPNNLMTPEAQAQRAASAIDHIREARNAELAAVQQLHDLAEERLALARQETQSARERVAAAAEVLRMERQREADVASRFGRLTDAQQMQLRKIAESRAGGRELSEQEARYLDQSGFGGALTADFFAKKGRAAGSDLVFQQLEGGKQSTGQQQLAQANADLTKFLREEGVARQEARLAQVALRDSLLELKDELALLRAAMEKARTDAQNTPAQVEAADKAPQAANNAQGPPNWFALGGNGLF